jgi:hypothetical protein
MEGRTFRAAGSSLDSMEEVFLVYSSQEIVSRLDLKKMILTEVNLQLAIPVLIGLAYCIRMEAREALVRPGGAAEQRGPLSPPASSKLRRSSTSAVTRAEFLGPVVIASVVRPPGHGVVGNPQTFHLNVTVPAVCLAVCLMDCVGRQRRHP